MVERILRSAIGLAYAGSLTPAWRRFQRAAADPAAAQREMLFAFLCANAETAYGRAHRFAHVDTVRRFQDAVPIADFESLAPWIQRIAAGEPRVLTMEPVRIFERSGGTTARTKLIPYTDALLREFRSATGPWIWNLYANRPRLLTGSSYWSISPVAQERQRSAGGIPIGFADDTEYFGRFSRWGVRRLLAVPPAVSRFCDVDRWRRWTLRHLLAQRDLVLVSVWSPTFLTLLMQALETDLPELLHEIPPRRAREVEAALAHAGDRGLGELLWPRLTLISCWTDGASRSAWPALRHYFPGTEIQSKGLLATEGVVSVPILGEPAPVAAVASHFLEFQDLAQPQARPRLVHELEVGGHYSPLLTTGGGLVRYALKDALECVGYHRRAPLLRFEGRLDQVADLCGEKVSPQQLEAALRAALDEVGVRAQFALVAPSQSPSPHYRLFLEADAPDHAFENVARSIDRALARSHPYCYCRDLGQLGPLRAIRVRHGARSYQQALVTRGQRLGSIKPTLLDPRPIWNEAFEVVGPQTRRERAS